MSVPALAPAAAAASFGLPGAIGDFIQVLPDTRNDWRILALAVLCLAEALLIVFLLAGRVRRWRGNAEAREEHDALIESEKRLRDLSGRLIKAQENERARLARDLHDDVTQRLARLAIDVGRIERGGAGVSAAEMLPQIQQGLARLSEDVHALAYQLHPSVLEDLGLADALRTECEHFSRSQSIAAEIQVQDLPEKLPRETSICLFRIAQEALRNVVRHARARVVFVSIAPLDGGLQLAVRDDGVGFDPALHRGHPTLGHASMLERTRLLDGELDIESAPGRGTTVLAWVPLKGASP